MQTADLISHVGIPGSRAERLKPCGVGSARALDVVAMSFIRMACRTRAAGLFRGELPTGVALAGLEPGHRRRLVVCVRDDGDLIRAGLHIDRMSGAVSRAACAGSERVENDLEDIRA